MGVLLFENVELLDFAGPYEVFSLAGKRDNKKLFSLFTVAESDKAVRTSNGVTVIPDYTFGNAPEINILLVPGGTGTRTEMHNDRTIEWILGLFLSLEHLLSVCTGALVLAKAGLLDGLDVTTHHAAVDLLRQTAPEAKIVTGRRVVDNGKVVLSAGISAGIDMSFYFISKNISYEEARSIATHMEYDWPKRGVF